MVNSQYGRLIMHVQFTPKYQYRWMLKLKFTVSSPRGWSIEDYTVSQAWNDPHHVGAQNSSTWPPHQPPSDADSAKIHPLFVVLTGSIHPGGQPPPEWPDPGWTSAPQRISWASDFNPFPSMKSPKGRIFPQFFSHIFLANRNKNPCVFQGPPPGDHGLQLLRALRRFTAQPTQPLLCFFWCQVGSQKQQEKWESPSFCGDIHISYILYIYIFYCVYIYMCVCTNIHNGIYIYIIRTMTFWECLRKVDQSQFMAGLLSMGYHPVCGLPNHGYSVL